MSQIGGGHSFYNDLPDSYSLVVNSNHPLIEKISEDMSAVLTDKLSGNTKERSRLMEEIEFLEKEHKGKKDDEIPQVEKDDLEKLRKDLDGINDERKKELESYGSENKLVKQLIDLALLSNNMLRGEELSTFVKRSVDLL